MRDIAAVEFGAKMTEASSHHSKFLPKNILDRSLLLKEKVLFNYKHKKLVVISSHIL